MKEIKLTKEKTTHFGVVNQTTEGVKSKNDISNVDKEKELVSMKEKEKREIHNQECSQPTRIQGQLYTQNSYGQMIPFDRHLTPARYFFKLHFAANETVWIRATHLKSFGGSGESEKLAQRGDAMLNYYVTTILNERCPNLTNRQLYERKQRYITNKQLASLDGQLHISHSIFQKSLIKLSDKKVATIVEALIATVDDVYFTKLTKAIIIQLMKIIDGHLYPPILCGAPILLDSDTCVGLLSCVTPGSATYFSEEMVEQINNGII